MDEVSIKEIKQANKEPVYKLPHYELTKIEGSHFHYYFINITLTFDDHH